MVVYYVRKSRCRNKIGPMNLSAAQKEVERYAKLGIVARILEEEVALSTAAQDEQVAAATKEQSALERMHEQLGWKYGPSATQQDAERDSLRSKFRNIIPA